ncbi:uncharacterized protein LOC110987772 [Acanthaster planci]|uniref:Uncharacterized protein LOC110987772 n=1 Tax=Acanthaster planci TaxID=133434 RepID=A0A8B7ZSU8_ACAPL|nr:uncharacterized protein LOC110987772 [Acanthaster planci]
MGVIYRFSLLVFGACLAVVAGRNGVGPPRPVASLNDQHQYICSLLPNCTTWCSDCTDRMAMNLFDFLNNCDEWKNAPATGYQHVFRCRPSSSYVACICTTEDPNCRRCEYSVQNNLVCFSQENGDIHVWPFSEDVAVTSVLLEDMCPTCSCSTKWPTTPKLPTTTIEPLSTFHSVEPSMITVAGRTVILNKTASTAEDATPPYIVISPTITAAGVIVIIFLLNVVRKWRRKQRILRVQRPTNSRAETTNRVAESVSHQVNLFGVDIDGSNTLPLGTLLITSFLMPVEGTDPDISNHDYECPDAVLARHHRVVHDYLELHGNTSSQTNNSVHYYASDSNLPAGPPMVHTAPPNDDSTIFGYDDVFASDGGQESLGLVKPDRDTPEPTGDSHDYAEVTSDFPLNPKSTPAGSQKSLGPVKPVLDPPIFTEFVYDYAGVQSDPHPSPEAGLEAGEKSPGRPDRGPTISNEDVHDYAEVPSNPNPDPESPSEGGCKSSTAGQT